MEYAECGTASEMLQSCYIFAKIDDKSAAMWYNKSCLNPYICYGVNRMAGKCGNLWQGNNVITLYFCV